MFGLLEIPKMVGAAVIAAGLTYAVVAPVKYAAGYSAGKTTMVVAVTRQNSKATAAARQAKSAIDECDEAGGTWKQEDGTCSN